MSEAANVSHPGLLRRLDANIRASMREWVGLFGASDAHPVSLALLVVAAVAFLPAYLVLLPLYRTFVRSTPAYGRGARLSVAVIQGLALLAALAPLGVMRDLEVRYGTTQLCQECARPGEIAWYKSKTGEGKLGRVYCSRHIDQAPEEIRDQAPEAGTRVETLGSDLWFDVGLAAVLWASMIGFVWSRSRGEIDWAAVMSLPIVPAVLALGWVSNLTLYERWLAP
jgi:hypothetical protein